MCCCPVIFTLELMEIDLFWLAVGSYVVFVAFCIGFIETLKAEAPSLYKTLRTPTAGRLVWSRQIAMPFSGAILFRSYREVLAPYPRSRAWASWLFWIHWAQLLALVAFVVSLFVGGHEL
jgi:hypothetical protein